MTDRKTPTSEEVPTPLTPRERLLVVLRWLRVMVIAAFVTAQLLGILWGGLAYRMIKQHYRNHDAEPPESVEQLDRWVERVQSLSGTGQNWRLYSPPVWRRSEFPAVRLTFDTSEQELILSDNEPTDIECYCRTGRWRLRRIEDFLVVHHNRKQYPSEEPLWRAYVRAAAERWRREHPNDPRRLARAEFVARVYHHPDPTEEPRPPRAVEQKVLFEWDLTEWKLRGEPPARPAQQFP